MAEVYSQLFKYIIEHGKRLEFLCCTANVDGMFPSWFPMLKGMRWGRESRHRSASAKIPARAEIRSNGTILRAKGFRIDWFASKTTEDLVFGSGSRWLKELRDMDRRTWPPGSDEHGGADGPIAELLFWWTQSVFYRNLLILKDPTITTVTLHAEEQKRLAWRKLAQAFEGNPQLSLIDLVSGQAGLNQAIDEEISGISQIAKTVYRTSFVYTRDRKLLGLATEKAEVGDELWILFGCRLPLILRPKNDGTERYTFVGPTLVPKLQDGKACDGILEDGTAGPDYKGPPLQTVEIV